MGQGLTWRILKVGGRVVRVWCLAVVINFMPADWKMDYLWDLLRRARLLSDAMSKGDIGNGPFGGDAYKRLMHSRMYTYLLDPRAQYPNDRKHFEKQEEGRREKAISK